jgi:hypothetical protein
MHGGQLRIAILYIVSSSNKSMCCAVQMYQVLCMPSPRYRTFYLLSWLRVICKKLGRDIYFCMHQFGVPLDESFAVRNEFEKLSPIQREKKVL